MSDLSKRFVWGRVIEEQVIGPYTIRAYHPKDEHGVHESTVIYHGYIEGEDACRGWGSLDEALVGLIIVRWLGENSDDIGQHFMAGVIAMSKGGEA